MKLKPVIFMILGALTFGMLSKVQAQQKVFTIDIDNFWKAFDSVRTTVDSVKQVNYIQTLYIDKGTEGLKAFMKARGYSAPLYVSLIRRYPKFWNSIRPNTLSVKNKGQEIEKSIQKFKKLYPELKEAKMYFTIGGLRSGGTVGEGMVLVGAEIATGNPKTDASEFPNDWLRNVFKGSSEANLVRLNVHEYVHTQQSGYTPNLLAQSIKEGACDFITELVMNKLLDGSYATYGRAHEDSLKKQFKEEMFTPATESWLYNGSNAKVADLGYYMGYAICKSYYKQAIDKKKAIKEIIELNYDEPALVTAFLKRSNYYPEGFDEAELIKKYEAKQPRVLRIEPFANGDQNVDPALKQIRIVFSEPMSNKGYSIDLGELGKDHFPITKVGEFAEDGYSITMYVDLKPGTNYDFVVTGRSFKSVKGYALKSFPVAFKTK
ncbi:Ig-like domain-containing protein [Pedobacter sp. KR3-3]|uniref:Ig-like domain-containing protein n=1 Tax=Pedobacter albus TaxID=3113905 RepID=A0ABU7I5G7_9SPHI|nr:Ig-like domain-containing protein [Pedobacter sp. KR3-3]MEE1944678.1 Ig-like domain-containing protein [Pedobacter sp. KR3-3]